MNDLRHTVCRCLPRPGNALLPRRVAYISLRMPGLRISPSPGKTWDITWIAPSSGGMLSGTRGSAVWSASFPRKTRNGSNESIWRKLKPSEPGTVSGWMWVCCSPVAKRFQMNLNRQGVTSLELT